MIRKLIVSLLLLLIASFLWISGREISLKNKKTYLVTEGYLKEHPNLKFKLSFNSNRLRLRRKTRFLPFTSGSSFYPPSVGEKRREICANSSAYNESAYRNSLTLSQKIWIPNLELVFTDDPKVSDWLDFNGVLGLNPFVKCNDINGDSLDPLAPINQLRRNYMKFSLDTDKLIFTNVLFQGFQLPLIDGMLFEMEQMVFGHYNFGGAAMKGTIDLDSRYMKVPSQYFDEIAREFKFLEEADLLFSDKATRYVTDNMDFNIEIAIAQPSKGKSLKLPLFRYWDCEIVEDFQGLEDSYFVKISFVSHNESYWSFGVHFLEDFRVHWDLNGKKIGFEPRNSD